MSWMRLGKILKQDCIDGFEIYGGNTTIDEIELIFNKYKSKEVINIHYLIIVHYEKRLK